MYGEAMSGYKILNVNLIIMKIRDLYVIVRKDNVRRSKYDECCRKVYKRTAEVLGDF